MELRTGSVYFQPLRGDGPRTASQTVVFPREVVRAVAGLSGYAVGFTADDHHLGELDTAVSADAVTVTYGLRDWSGTWDDNYDGTIQFVVIAELAALRGPPPRGDLIITGVELN